MVDYDIFREQLGIRFPAYGYALWDPSPRRPDRPVKVGDVGFIRRGKFHSLFNILCPKGEQSDTPESYEQLVPRSLDHITEGLFNSGHYCSLGVGVRSDHHAGLDDFRQVSIECSGRRGGALLSLPVDARSEDTLAKSAFGEWIVKHIDSCFAFAQELQLGIDEMEEIILVTGCDLTRSWTNVAFMGGQLDAKGSYGVKAVERADSSIEIQLSSGHVAGGLLSHGPQGTNLPENQCVFIRGFRAARTSRTLPNRLKAAGDPSPEPEGYDCEPDTEPISLPVATKYRDPLHVLMDYIAERAYDCDIILVHDQDLERIDAIGDGSSLESLQPEVVMDLLRSSNIEIHKVCCDLSPASNIGPGTGTGTVWVAMLSMLSKNWDTVIPSQPLPPAPRWQNPIPGDINLCDNAPLTGVGGVSEFSLLARDKIGRSLSGVWSSQRRLAHTEYHKLVATIAFTYFTTALFGWIFSFAWLDISKHWFTVLLASFTLWLWFDRKYTHRRLDEIREKMKTLQRDMASHSNPATTALVAGAETSGYCEPRAEISLPHQPMAATPQGSTGNLVELYSSDLVDGAAEQRIENLNSNAVSDSILTDVPFHPTPSPHADFRVHHSATPDDLPVVDRPSRSSTPPPQYGHPVVSPPSPPVDGQSQRSVSPNVRADRDSSHYREPAPRGSWTEPDPVFITPYSYSHSDITSSQPPPSPLVNPRRKLRVSSSFNPFKSDFPHRSSPIQSGHVTTASPTTPPEKVQKRSRSSRFFNSVKSTFSPRKPSITSGALATTSSEPVIPTHTAP